MSDAGVRNASNGSTEAYVVQDNNPTVSSGSAATKSYLKEGNNALYSFSSIIEQMGVLVASGSQLLKQSQTEANRASQTMRENAKQEAKKAAQSSKKAAIIDGVFGASGATIGGFGYIKKGLNTGLNRLKDRGSWNSIRSKESAIEFNKKQTRQMRKFFENNKEATRDILSMAETNTFSSVETFTKKYEHFPIKDMTQQQFESTSKILANRARRSSINPETMQVFSTIGQGSQMLGKPISGVQNEQASQATNTSEREKEMQRHTEKQRDEFNQSQNTKNSEYSQKMRDMAQVCGQVIASSSGKFA